jgi:iron(III) transport system substrate-binding protein
VHVRILTDAEANKTVGLAERLRAEKSNPQADVYWGNEVFNTIRLAEEGVLTGYDSPSVRDVPQQYKDPGNRWAANGLRVRVIANHDGPAAKMLVASRLSDLTDPRFRDHVLMARPTAGTTGGHVAALYVLWGKERAQKFFQDLRSNGVRLVGGNSIVAEEVGRGTMWAGLTDNDDAAAARRDGGQLKTILPDQQGGEIGTLAIPCAVGLVAGAKHRPAAERLIDYLLSEEVERQLVDAQFAYASVRDGASAVKAMDVDYRKVAEAMPEAIRDATAILEGR